VLIYIANRRPNGRYYRRGAPRQRRQTQQDSQGEDKTEGTEGKSYLTLIQSWYATENIIA